MDGKSFIDEILEEAEAEERQLSIEYIDLLLIEIRDLTSKINENWEVAEKEITIINNFYLSQNYKMQERIERLEFKLKDFILSQKQRTIDLPNGTIRLRKGREKVIVENLQEFLQCKHSHELLNVKEELKPDLTKIKSFIIRSGVVPNGCKVQPPNENEFSYKLKGVVNEPKT